MSTFPWTEDPPGAREFPAYCRGCSIPIRQLNAESELWEDPAGLTVCVKARLVDVGGGKRPDFILHQPMPDGLVGAPLQP
jgi:hypothetical protein